MDERIARLTTSRDAAAFAANARRHGRPDLEAEALTRERELRAQEEGFKTPAERAIAEALFAYEEERTRANGSTFRASRTRQMLKRHGALKAAERMVLQRAPSVGFEVLEEAGLQQLSFEAIIDRFAEEFSPEAVAAARARLNGEPPPKFAGEKRMQAPAAVATLSEDANELLSAFHLPEAWFLENWMPRYESVTRAIAEALVAGRPHETVDTLWKTQENGISHAGSGMINFDSVDGLRDELASLSMEIYEDGSPEHFELVVAQFEQWREQQRVLKVPRLLVARAFAGIHPSRYHTTVDSAKNTSICRWFAVHTGFVAPDSGNWAASALALTTHLDSIHDFKSDLHRNVFPWFVIDQLRTEPNSPRPPAGHTPRPAETMAQYSPERRAIALRHNLLQQHLYDALLAEFPGEYVKTEYPTGRGGYADAVVIDGDGALHLYEIKVTEFALLAVRQAMGQLLEYAYREGGLNPVTLTVVAEPPLDAVTERYLARLKQEFGLPISYRQEDISGLPKG